MNLKQSRTEVRPSNAETYWARGPHAEDEVLAMIVFDTFIPSPTAYDLCTLADPWPSSSGRQMFAPLCSWRIDATMRGKTRRPSGVIRTVWRPGCVSRPRIFTA